MSSKVVELFTDFKLVEKIKKRLPYLFQLAELESSRAGKIGMEVGSVREKIIVALLIYKFGEANVETEIPITESEMDVKLFGQPLSIKTFTIKSITSERLSGVKLTWTVDAPKSKEFRDNYYPQCDILFVKIRWGGVGGFYYIPLEVQTEILKKLGSIEYIKLPKMGTNPRGIEITEKALISLIESKETKSIEINWQKSKLEFNSYKRWVELWRED